MVAAAKDFVELPGIAQLRVHAVSGAPAGDASTASFTNLYVSPFDGNRMYLPVGGVLQEHIVPAQTTIALGTSTSGRGRDLWAYSNGAGGVAYELGTVWDSATARASGQDAVETYGIHLRESDPTRVLIASFYLTSTTVCQDTFRQRLLWNRFNQRSRQCYFVTSSTADTYSYASATLRQMDASATNQIEVMSGLVNRSEISLTAMHLGYGAIGTALFTGIGINSSTVNSASNTGQKSFTASGDALFQIITRLEGAGLLGKNEYRQLEWAANTSGALWSGTNSGARSPGIVGRVWQ